LVARGQRSAFAVALTVLAAVAAAALGESRALAAEDVEQLIQQGNQMRREGDNEGAYRMFSRAYALSKTPRTTAQMGLCEYALLRFVDAEAHLAEALRARNDAWIVSKRADLKRSLDEVRSLLGWLEVVGRPEGAEVEISGRTVGKLPLREPVRLPSGEVYLRVSREGYTSFRRAVLVPPGSSARVVIDLDRMDLPPGVSAPVSENRASDGPPPAIDVRTSASGANSWRWPAAWVSGGAAALLAGAGVWGWLVHDGKVKDFDAIKQPGTNSPRCSTAASESGGGQCPVLLAEANQAKTIAVGAFVGAGVAAVLATVFFATAPSAEEKLALAPPCMVAVDRQGAGAACGWRF
jgi:hypothetical protein